MPSQPFIGNIILFAGNFAPSGWMFCEGQLLPISENDALFNLIGTTYGGDGQETFALPDLRGRLPLHMGIGGGITYQIGEQGGVEQVTLTTQQIPSHSHVPVASRDGVASTNPAGNMLSAGAVTMYTNSLNSPVAMAPSALAPAGGSQPHNNLQPYVCINYIISLFGVYPSPS